jgi:hypothetical protein
MPDPFITTVYTLDDSLVVSYGMGISGDETTEVVTTMRLNEEVL